MFSFLLQLLNNKTNSSGQYLQIKYTGISPKEIANGKENLAL